MKKKKAEAAGDLDSHDSFSIAEFCRRNSMCISHFYKFRKQMPKGFRIGGRVLITRESAERWRRERDAAA